MKKTIVFTCGVFDLFHNGHKELLELMRSLGDKVYIFLHDDRSTYENKNKFPVQSFEHRYDNLKETYLVNNIYKVAYPNPVNYFKSFVKIYGLKHNLIYVRGDDWKDAPGLDYLKEAGIKIIFKKYTQGISSTKLRSEL